LTIFTRQTAIGRITVGERGGFITHVYFETDPQPENARTAETPGIVAAFSQLEAYLAGKLSAFTLPFAPQGTAFMQSVWERLCEIPYGQTNTYGQIAAALSRPGAARAVGNANNRNPIPIFIPCHRVIGADGSLTGYRGGLEVKKKLLDLESK